MVKKRIENETKRDRFKRLAKIRTQKVLEKIRVLGHCSNNTLYEYNEKDINMIFSAIDKELKRTRFLFSKPSKDTIEFD